jgi:hypothetical protein
MTSDQIKALTGRIMSNTHDTKAVATDVCEALRILSEEIDATNGALANSDKAHVDCDDDPNTDDCNDG